MSDHDRLDGFTRFLLLTALSTALSVGATMIVRARQRRRAEAAAWAQATDTVPPSPSDPVG